MSFLVLTLDGILEIIDSKQHGSTSVRVKLCNSWHAMGVTGFLFYNCTFYLQDFSKYLQQALTCPRSMYEPNFQRFKEKGKIFED